MLIVTNLAGVSEVVTKYNNFEMNEELNGGFTLSFSSFLHEDNPGHEVIQQESIVEYEGYKFRVKQLKINTYSKQVTAISTYFDKADDRKYDIYGGGHTLDEFLTYTLSGTGWTFINDNVTGYAFIPDFGNANVVKLIDELKAAFKCEMKIESNNVLRFSMKLGPDNDYQYRYGHNMLALSESIDTTKIKTYIEGFGPGGLHMTYTSPVAATLGIRHAEPIYVDKFEGTDDDFLELLKKTLNDQPESMVELDALELQEKELGESVWLIHERLGLAYQTRVVYKKTKFPKTSSSVVLGNYKPQTFSKALADQKVEIERINKQTKSRIDQTNENIVLEVERLDGGISEAKASIILTADEIRSEVSAEVERLDGSIADTNSSITQTADQIRSEVSTSVATAEANANAYTDDSLSPVEERLLAAESSITQNAEQITLRVDAVYVDGRFTEANEYTDSTADSIYNRISAAESSITQNADEIALRVSKTDYTGATVMTLIDQTSEEIRFKASRIQMEGITHVDGNLELGRGWEPGGTNGAKSLIFSNAGSIKYIEGFQYDSGTFGHRFNGSVKFNAVNTDPLNPDTVDFNGAQITGLNVTVVFG